jgi:HEAT repeat protein
MIKRLTVTAVCLALTALCGCGPSYKLYAERMNSSSVEERRAAAKELRAVPKDRKYDPVILQACRDRDADVRMYGYFSIRKIDARQEGVVEALFDGLRDTVIHVRRAVASSLGEINPFPNTLLPAMVKLLTDPDEQVRRMMLSAFSNLQGIGVPALMRHIDTQDEELRLAIVNVLGQIGPAAKGGLPRLKKMSAEDEDLRIREAAERAVRFIEGK